eukprot:TRINITY_DN932_c0_g1_i1.p1 TRINITY_DN932_c0_g1~~TRINITY_DN932_c0_g1_i1.p1  ORF type:complete len:1862 (-),score=264.80 TRINITY_DN932_c0_g1_i1:730-6315(-)
MLHLVSLLGLLLRAVLVWAAPWTEENGPWNVNVETKHEPSQYRGNWAGHTYFPSPPDWRGLIIYQLLTDRFADGDPRNNELHAGGFDVRDVTFRHGGDFVGLTKKLYYIKGLGCNAIWISPIFQNGFNFYHQYGQLDFTTLDRRLGTLAELRTLVTEAHNLGIYVIVDVVMNHMANEFYFEGLPKESAPWRFHDNDGLREYRLKPRKSMATEFASGVWCGGEALWQEYGDEPRGILVNQNSCEDMCAADQDCLFYLWKNDLGSLNTYHCAGFSKCDEPIPYEYGRATIFQTQTFEVAMDVWCGGAGLWSDSGNEPLGILASKEACESRCATDENCLYYLWKNDSSASTRFHCAGFDACDDRSSYDDGDRSRIFMKTKIGMRDSGGMFHTPAGRQPYADFWYNNTWDPSAQYNGTVYGQWGESKRDTGFGTYDGSDFHHNGDLSDFSEAWQINLGKIYGTMDDLRLEHGRVQQKYIAMTKALIESTDVDGFRVDTPMQVPLNFFKAWAPAMRAHAKSLGKERFGIFGEFYVSPARYATMTGRGRDNTMYNQNRFIDDIPTLKGGIVYPYYWYMFTSLVYKLPEYADGLPLAYREENKMIDTFDPSTQRSEYSMWIFCNNHDNWRLQTITGKAEMRMCLAVISFWPGVPLHYAGDEQDFDTPGSALDGWAREELSASLAWRAMKTSETGNPADKDNFDMTSSTYRYIARLNALRRLYFGDFGRDECDELQLPSQAITDVLIFIRGCTSSSKVAVFANFHWRDNKTALTEVPWPAGTPVADTLVASGSREFVVSSAGSLTMTLGPFEALVVAPVPTLAVPPAVVSVWPEHGMTVDWPTDDQVKVNLSLSFDRQVSSFELGSLKFDGQVANFRCFGTLCTLQLNASTVSNGHHFIEVAEGASSLDGTRLRATFRSMFMVDRQRGAIANTAQHHLPGLICSDAKMLCHRANGAEWLRIQTVGANWSEWMPYESETHWPIQRGIPVLVQYYSQTSASFVVGDCVGENSTCFTSWHKEMFLRGDWNGWGQQGDKGLMHLVDHFTWASNITLSKFSTSRLAPYHDWSKSYGLHPANPLLYNVPDFDPRHLTFKQPSPFMSGSEANRQWMVNRGLWTKHQSIASGAEFATDLWLNHLCTAEAPTCVPEVGAAWQCHGFQFGQDQAWCNTAPVQDCTEFRANDWSPSMASCGSCSCCRKKIDKIPEGTARTCCVLFNDLFLNYTVTPDLSKCSAAPQTATTSTLPISDTDGTSGATSTSQQHIEKTSSTGITAVGSSTSAATSSSTSASSSSSTNALSSTTQEVATSTSLEPCAQSIEEVRVKSAGHSDGDTAMFSLDGVQVPLIAARGLNVVVLGQNGSILTKQVFDTGYEGTGSQPFAGLINGLATGTPVLVAAKDDAFDSLTASAKEALQSVGATESISYRGSYALVGIRGGKAIAERASASGDGAVEVIAYDILGNGCGKSSSTLSTSTSAASNVISIRMKSAGALDGDSAEFFVNDVPAAETSGRGLNVVILGPAGNYVSHHVFDTGYGGTGSGPFAALLDGLAAGTTVLVAAKDDATDSLTQEAKLALESIGATKSGSMSYRGSYALVGIKGGQALAEGVSASGDGAVQLLTELRPSGDVASSTTPATNFISIRVKSAGSLDGDSAEFIVNDVHVAETSGRGLNVVILGPTGNYVSHHVFDTGYGGTGSGPFAALLDGLAADTTVLVAAKDDATDSLTQAAKLALESVGATKSGSMSYRGSYALVGIKGGQALAEGVSASGDGAIQLVTRLRPGGDVASSANPSTSISSTPSSIVSTSMSRPTPTPTLRTTPTPSPTPMPTSVRTSSTTRTPSENDKTNLESDSCFELASPATKLISMSLFVLCI